jgi:hypothetical protein
LALLMLFAFLRRRHDGAPKFFWGYVAATASLAIAIAFAAALAIENVGIEQAYNVFQIVTVEKAGGSGESRWELFKNGLSICLDTGLLGSGWGSNSTADLTSTLLANVGIPGLALFLIFVWYVTSQASRRDSYSGYQVGPAVSTAIWMHVLLMLIAVPGFIAMYFWILLGIAISCVTDSADRVEEPLHRAAA